MFRNENRMNERENIKQERTAAIPNAFKLLIVVFLFSLPVGLIVLLTIYVTGERLPDRSYTSRAYSLSISGYPPLFEFNKGKGLIIRQFEGFRINELDDDYHWVDTVWSIQNMNPDYALPRLEYGFCPMNWTQLDPAKPIKTNRVYDLNQEFCFKRLSDGSYTIFPSPFRKDNNSR